MNIIGSFANIASPQPWQSQALCAQVSPEIFFPERGERANDAKRICNECPVRLECLHMAVDNDERFGVWGGLTEVERRRLRKPPSNRFCSNHHDLRVVGTTETGYCRRCRAEAHKRYDRRRRAGQVGA